MRREYCMYALASPTTCLVWASLSVARTTGLQGGNGAYGSIVCMLWRRRPPPQARALGLAAPQEPRRYPDASTSAFLWLLSLRGSGGQVTNCSPRAQEPHLCGPKENCEQTRPVACALQELPFSQQTRFGGERGCSCVARVVSTSSPSRNKGVCFQQARHFRIQ